MSQREHWYSSFRQLVKKPEPRSSQASQSKDETNTLDQAYEFDGDDLGPHANEKRMPRWLIRVLEKGDKTISKPKIGPDGTRTQIALKVVETPDLVPILVKLSKADSTTRQAVYCSPEVHYVAKLRREGSFCGYRNLQMMLSYIRNIGLSGCRLSTQETLPSIFSLQQMIEQAWEKGFNTSSREVLGSIYMTRKFIGTSEVEALLLSLNVPVVTKAFVTTSTATAYKLLVNHVAIYFGMVSETTAGEKASLTSKPPIFLQRPGHSMTIVGVDEDAQGSRALMIFDPHDEPKPGMKKLASGEPLPIKDGRMLKAYRYGAAQLSKFDAFEVVELDGQIITSG